MVLPYALSCLCCPSSGYKLTPQEERLAKISGQFQKLAKEKIDELIRFHSPTWRFQRWTNEKIRSFLYQNMQDFLNTDIDTLTWRRQVITGYIKKKYP